MPGHCVIFQEKCRRGGRKEWGSKDMQLTFPHLTVLIAADAAEKFAMARCAIYQKEFLRAFESKLSRTYEFFFCMSLPKTYTLNIKIS